MKTLPFKASRLATLGIELEFQIINPHSYALMSRAKELIRNIKQSQYHQLIKPEITQSMIEINSSVHHSTKELLKEIESIQAYLKQEADGLNIAFCGGGTHPFQKYEVQKIYPLLRYKKLSRIYRYLSKRATVFGQHIHVGCQSADDALYLTHALARYVPHFIAICASSPFYQGIDTGYHSTRTTLFNAFPMSGVIPFLTTWSEFAEYFYKLKDLQIISTMKDFYWDIRPKPEYGTVEIRVCDTPLTLKKSIVIAAYIQALALYLITERPFQITQDLYYLYTYNRFQACRYGFQGEFIDAFTFKRQLIADDIRMTIKKIERYANQLNNMPFLSVINDDVLKNRNDALFLRNYFKQVGSLAKVVEAQCRLWNEPL